MTEEKRDEAFLNRWSRLKQQDAREEVKPAPAEARAEPMPAAPLPAIEDLKPDSDFKPFMDPQVDAGTRRAALKKLFTDAHFNTIDPFEPYSIDLTGEDPISPEMMKTINHAKRLLFDDSEKLAEASQATPEPTTQADPQSNPQSNPHTTDATDVTGKQDA